MNSVFILLVALFLGVATANQLKPAAQISINDIASKYTDNAFPLPSKSRKLDQPLRSLIQSLQLDATKNSWSPESDVVAGNVKLLRKLFQGPASIPKSTKVSSPRPRGQLVAETKKIYETKSKDQAVPIQRKLSVQLKDSVEEPKTAAQESVKIEEIPDDVKDVSELQKETVDESDVQPFAQVEESKVDAPVPASEPNQDDIQSSDEVEEIPDEVASSAADVSELKQETVEESDFQSSDEVEEIPDELAPAAVDAFELKQETVEESDVPSSDDVSWFSDSDLDFQSLDGGDIGNMQDFEEDLSSSDEEDDWEEEMYFDNQGRQYYDAANFLETP